MGRKFRTKKDRDAYLRQLRESPTEVLRGRMSDSVGMVEIGPREDCTPEVREWWDGVKRAAQDPAFWERDPITFDLRSAHA